MAFQFWNYIYYKDLQIPMHLRSQGYKEGWTLNMYCTLYRWPILPKVAWNYYSWANLKKLFILCVNKIFFPFPPLNVKFIHVYNIYIIIARFFNWLYWICCLEAIGIILVEKLINYWKIRLTNYVVELMGCNCFLLFYYYYLEA